MYYWRDCFLKILEDCCSWRKGCAIVFLLRKEKDRFEENSFRDEKSPHLGRQLLAMSAIRTKFDEFCLIDPRTKTKFWRGKGRRRRRTKFQNTVFYLTSSPRLIVPVHERTVQTELDSLTSKGKHGFFVKTTPDDSVCKF